MIDLLNNEKRYDMSLAVARPCNLGEYIMTEFNYMFHIAEYDVQYEVEGLEFWNCLDCNEAYEQV